MCDIERYEDLWEIRKEKRVASIGWPYLTNRGREAIDTIRSFKKGDRVVAYLKLGRIGGIGTLTGSDMLGEWYPLLPEDEEHGRQVGVDWNALPKEGCYAMAPDDISRPHRRTLRKLLPSEVSRLERIVRNPDAWEALASAKHLASKEKRELHPLVKDGLDDIEKGLEIYDLERPFEYPMDPIGKVDIMARDKDGNPVAIEAKKHTADNATVGQIARYMGWLRLKKNRKNVRGIIIAGEFSPKTRYAAIAVEGLSLVRYAIRNGKIELRRVRGAAYH